MQPLSSQSFAFFYAQLIRSDQSPKVSNTVPNARRAAAPQLLAILIPCPELTSRDVLAIQVFPQILPKSLTINVADQALCLAKVEFYVVLVRIR